MAAIKTVTKTVRVAPALKQGLKTAAEQEHRSIANMDEVMIRDYCGRNGVAITDSKRPTVPARALRGQAK